MSSTDAAVPDAPRSALDAERVRSAEDRRRVERLGAGLSAGRGPLQRVAARLRGAGRRAAPRSSPVRRTGSDRAGLRIAVLVAAPNDRMAVRWGDWHLAAALARALERLGHVALVTPRDRRDDPDVRTCDVELVLRGLAPPPRTTHGPRILWVISHPDEVTPAECDTADLVLVASARFAEHLRARTSTPVEVFLQATDHHRFRPLPTDPAHAHPIVVVAKTRDVPRPIVMDAVAAGLRPAIHGTGWDRFVDPSLVVADHVPNDVLPRVYSSAGVVLNDHWDAMRRWGFVSNRVFDVLACGAPLISDDLPELGDLLGDAVLRYREPADLRTLVDRCLDAPVQARQRAAAGRELVLRDHTFDRRAELLVGRLRAHGWAGGAP